MTKQATPQEFEKVLANGGTAAVHPEDYIRLTRCRPDIADKVVVDKRVERGTVCAVETYTPEEETQQICKTCRFFDDTEHPPQKGTVQMGNCRKRSPFLVAGISQGLAKCLLDEDCEDAEMAVWPVVRYWDWCGEWQPSLQSDT